jgi:hypothetical protein
MVLHPVTRERPTVPADDIEALFRAHWPDGIDSAIVTRRDRVVAGTWLLMLAAACAFVLAVAVSIVLDATGVAF